MNNLGTLDKPYDDLLKKELNTIDKTFFSKGNESVTKETLLEEAHEKFYFEGTEENRLSSFLYDDNTLETNDENSDLEKANENCTALITVKERRLMAAQTMFKKSIKVTIKSFLISLSLSFLNLFI